MDKCSLVHSRGTPKFSYREVMHDPDKAQTWIHKRLWRSQITALIMGRNKSNHWHPSGQDVLWGPSVFERIKAHLLHTLLASFFNSPKYPSSQAVMRKGAGANLLGLGNFSKARRDQRGFLPFIGLQRSAATEVLMCQGSFEPSQVSHRICW